MEIIPPNHAVANSVNLITGTTSSSVSDLQSLYTSNYHIDEAAVTPGIDLIITFTDIRRFSKLAFKSSIDSS